MYERETDKTEIRSYEFFYHFWAEEGAVHQLVQGTENIGYGSGFEQIIFIVLIFWTLLRVSTWSPHEFRKMMS
jgi:hypothetical protein